MIGLAASALATFGGTVMASATLPPKLPERWEFNRAREEFIDINEDTRLSRANCRKFRNYSVHRGADGLASVKYQEWSKEGWRRKTARLK